MIHNNIDTETQADIQILGKIDDFFDQFKIATFLHRYGVRKRHGHSVRSLIMAIFTLPFVGKNFFRGIAINDNLAFGKGAAYDVLTRIYGKRWDIEVFFKRAKQHLKLAKEMQCRDYDALVAHTRKLIRPVKRRMFFCSVMGCVPWL